MGGVKATPPRVLNLNTGWRPVVSSTPRPRHPRRKKGGWMGPTAGLLTLQGTDKYQAGDTARSRPGTSLVNSQ